MRHAFDHRIQLRRLPLGQFIGLAQVLLLLPQFGHLAKRDHDAHHTALDRHWLCRDLRDEGAPIFPEHHIRHLAQRFVVANYVIDRTLLIRKMTAVRIVVMHQFVHISTEQFLTVETKSTYSHPIDEGTVPFQIQAPNPLGG